jgi:hypothetical protein
MSPFSPRAPRGRGLAALAAVCSVVLLCAATQAGDTTRPTSRPQQRPAPAAEPLAPPTAVAPTPPLASGGMTIAVDPETGLLAPPSAVQALRLTAAERTGLMRTSEGLAEVRLPGGAVMLDLQGRFMEYSIARLDGTGGMHFVCANDADLLRALLTRLAPAPTPASEDR